MLKAKMSTSPTWQLSPEPKKPNLWSAQRTEHPLRINIMFRRRQVNGLTEAYKFSNSGSRLTHTRLSSACFYFVFPLPLRSGMPLSAVGSGRWPVARRSPLAAAAGGWRLAAGGMCDVWHLAFDRLGLSSSRADRA
mmetsp:Transcript_32368/g.103167  ORF Transcript_32368/g.103167 Transcript_32368/m.103167 type:complete len:136 (+) Transcript_32368:85-492(+)